MKQEIFSLVAIAPLVSLVCVAIHACIMWEGMVLHFIRVSYRAAVNELADILAAHIEIDQLQQEPKTVIDTERHARIIQKAAWLIKPIYACLMCMSSVWSIITWLMLGNTIGWQLIPLILFVCGINVLLDSIIYKLREHGDNSQL